MTLKGAAKTAYQREYMRRRRARLHADQPATKPDADVPTLLAEINQLKRQLKGARTQIANLKAMSGRGRK